MGQLVDKCKGNENSERKPQPPVGVGPNSGMAPPGVSSPSSANTTAVASDLPPGWEERRDPSGRPYYLNHNNKTTHWERPRSLPEGWEAREAGGRIYYVDHNTQTTHWNLPNTPPPPPPRGAGAEFRQTRSLLSESATQGANPISLLGQGRYVRAHAAFARGEEYQGTGGPEWIQLGALTDARDGHPNLANEKGQYEYAIMSSLPPPIGIWIRMKDPRGNVWMVHNDDITSVTRFSGVPVHEISRLQFTDKKMWFDQQLLRIRPPHTGATEIHLRRQELTHDSWNQVSALSVEQMRSDWTFQFAGETNTGDDAGGITREWFEIMTKEVFNEGIGLFKFTEAHNLAYQINEYSDCNQPQHLVWFKFTGRMMAKALMEGLPLKAHLAPTLYKHMLQVPIKLEDLKGIDTEQYNSLVYMKDNSVVDIFFETFSATTNNEIYGERVFDLKENGRNIDVTDENKHEYMSLYLEWRVYGNRKEQIKAFLGGFWEVIPVEFLKVFDWQQLELLMCGMPDVDVKDWKANTEFKGEYNAKHKVIQMFFKVVQAMEQEERSKLLQFVTSSSVVPVGGFSQLQGGQGEPCKFTIDAVPYTGKKVNGKWSNQLPKAHTCFNNLLLPLYPDKEVLHSSIIIALQSESEGFTMEE